MNPEISVLIVNYKTPELVADCVRSVRRHAGRIPLEIIIVDNESTMHSMQLLREYCPQSIIIANRENSGFGRGNNIGFHHARGRFLFLINSDAMVVGNCITVLVDFLKGHPEAAVVGPKVLLPDGSRQTKICGNIPTLRRLWNDALLLSRLFPRCRFLQGIHLDHIVHEITEVGWISGVCMLIRREFYERSRGFNPDFFLYAEDIDLCLRIRLDGGAIYHVRTASVIHQLGASSPDEKKKIFNSVQQQQNFLQALATIFTPHEQRRARTILRIGLYIRLGSAVLLRVADHRRGEFLAASCRARLSALEEDFL